MKKSVLILLPFLILACANDSKKNAEKALSDLDKTLEFDSAEIKKIIGSHDANNCPNLTGEYEVKTVTTQTDAEGKETTSESTSVKWLESTIVENGVKLTTGRENKESSNTEFIADGKIHAKSGLEILGICNEEKEVTFFFILLNIIGNTYKLSLNADGDLVEKIECTEESETCKNGFQTTISKRK